MFPKSLYHEPEAHSQIVSKRVETHFKTSVPPGLAGRVEQCKTTTLTCQRSESRFFET